jgi:hypothetical protein
MLQAGTGLGWAAWSGPAQAAATRKVCASTPSSMGGGLVKFCSRDPLGDTKHGVRNPMTIRKLGLPDEVKRCATAPCRPTRRCTAVIGRSTTV